MVMMMPNDDNQVCYLVLHFMTMMMVMMIMMMTDDDNQVCYLVLHFMIGPRQRC